MRIDPQHLRNRGQDLLWHFLGRRVDIGYPDSVIDMPAALCGAARKLSSTALH